MEIQNFSFMKMHLKMSSVKCRPLCGGEDEFIHDCQYKNLGQNQLWRLVEPNLSSLHLYSMPLLQMAQQH